VSESTTPRFEFEQRVALITGAAGALGQAFARRAATLGMKLVLADVDASGLNSLVAELREAGVAVVQAATNVSNGAEVEKLAVTALEAFGKIHLVFNNAGVGVSGPIWQASANDWDWVLGVNLMGVAHGIRVFTPLLLAQGEPAHIVNTASVAGLLNSPGLGLYNASKHAVIALSETLYHELDALDGAVGCSVLCPAWTPSGIGDSERIRPASLANATPPNHQQRLAARMVRRAVRSGELDAAEVARITFGAVEQRRFYILTHPQATANLTRHHDDLVSGRNPVKPDTF
jgi:NAD(P)-dependent dehydrogenase (short-subunit alcohol dehydrogenase family)